MHMPGAGTRQCSIKCLACSSSYSSVDLSTTTGTLPRGLSRSTILVTCDLNSTIELDPPCLRQLGDTTRSSVDCFQQRR